VESERFVSVVICVLLTAAPPATNGWGYDGHLITCKLAQPRFKASTSSAVSKLLPTYAKNDLSSLCSWADEMKSKYPWSAPLHYADTDNVCNFNYNRDCNSGICVVGAINNYTNQLLNSSSHYNLTEALLFLAHFVGDIHQPLHVGFKSNLGGNTITVYWYDQQTNLHSVWDSSIIETEEDDFFDSDVDEMIASIQHNITTGWANQIPNWEACSQVTCPNTYANESSAAACQWAYSDAAQGADLGDDYFFSRYPIVNLRLAQGGVRLAKVLNNIFG
ncbi:hypothetical protein M569_07466, partial [Genlisea aurea]